MKMNQIRVAAYCLASLVVVSSGCKQASSVAAEAAGALAPKVEGDTVEIATNSPQLGYVTVEPLRARQAVAMGSTGRLAWNDDATARVFAPVSGRIVEILAQPGARVSAGDTLAKVKSPDFGQAQNDARKAETDLQLAERALKRTRELLEHGAAAQKDVESAEADYARAVSEKKRALATLAFYGEDGNAADVNGIFCLKAPIGGVIVEKAITPGQEVRSDQVGADNKPLFVISDPSRLWLFLDVAEADAGSLKPNQEVLIRARALPEKVFHGRIEVIGEGLDAATRTIKARCAVDNSEKLLRAEMYVSANVAADANAGLEVPSKAVFLDHDEQYVFVETGPGQFARRKVKVGVEGNGRLLIMEGLSPGQRVVTEGCLLLQAVMEGIGS